MRTNIEIDDDLMARAMAASGNATKRETVHEALQLMVRLSAQEKVKSLYGKVEFDADYDYKALRRNRFPDWDGSE